MGYYANGSGTIAFMRELSDADWSAVENAVKDVIEYDVDRKNGWLSLWYDGKYYEEEVIAVLKKIAEAAPIRDANIEFSGEGDCHWRFIYEDGKWWEENGHVVYDGAFEL